jgi:hypothetical protein
MGWFPLQVQIMIGQKNPTSIVKEEGIPTMILADGHYNNSNHNRPLSGV